MRYVYPYTCSRRECADNLNGYCGFFEDFSRESIKYGSCHEPLRKRADLPINTLRFFNLISKIRKRKYGVVEEREELPAREVRANPDQMNRPSPREIYIAARTRKRRCGVR